MSAAKPYRHGPPSPPQGALDTESQRMNLGNEDGLDGEYVPSPDERVRTQVAD
jgi:hypothetical protein